MSRNVQLVLLCEDTQHEAFARRFLDKAGWSTRRLRVEKAPSGIGSAEQFVRDRFPSEAKAYRTHRNRVSQGIIVVLDGDKYGVEGRVKQLEAACRTYGIAPRGQDDRVAIFVPTWNIETWFAYLDGQSVDEDVEDYPRLERERDCRKHVDRLSEMCDNGSLREPSPASLQAACIEYKVRMPH